MDTLDSIPWPSRRHRPFVQRSPSSGTTKGHLASLDVFDWPDFADYAYGQGFFRLGMLGASALQQTDIRDPGLPIAMLYNFRHFLELAIKALIRSCCELLKEAEPDHLSDEHGLMPLWNVAKQSMARAFPPQQDRGDTLKHVERCLNDFHQVDPSSQVFRYSTDKTGKPVYDRLPELDLPRLVDTMMALHAFFQGCDIYAGELAQTKAEMEADYAP